MGRILLGLLLALSLGEVMASPVLAAIEVCTATCPDDRPDGTCDPTCADCVCCSHGVRPLDAASMPATPIAPFVRELPEQPAPIAPLSAPRDIFHVPLSLA
jgi:hypothetical protein